MRETAASTTPATNPRDLAAEARAAYRDGRFREAEQILRELIDADEAVPAFHLLLGRVHEHLGRTRLAATHYRRSLELDPELVEARLLLGLLHRQEGRDDEAVAAFEQVLQQRCDYRPALLALAVLLEARRQWQSAVPLLQRAVELNPSDLDVLRRLFSALANARDRSVRRLTLERLLSRSPHRAAILFQLAFMAQEDGQWEQASAILRQVVSADPSSVEAHEHLAHVSEVLERWEDAAESYGRALLMDPDRADWWAKRGAALARLGRLAEAEASCRAAAGRLPDSYDIWSVLWTVRRDLGDTAGATEACERALALAPDHPAARLGLVAALHAADRPADALERCRALAATPTDDVSWTTFMEVLKAFIRVPARALPDGEPRTWEYFHYNRDKVLAMLEAALTIRDRFPHTPRVFLGQGLIAWEKTMGFFEDARFMRCARKYDHLRMMVNWEWNLHVIQWAATHALRVPGDFVELGVYRGYTTAVTAENVGFDTVDKHWYLYDTFAGIPADQRTDGWPHAYDGMDPDAWHREVVTLFAPYRNIHVVRGRVPEVFGQRCPERIAFVHIDLNSATAEIGALEALYDRLSPGAVIVFDDYGWFTAREQFDAENRWMQARGLAILELPTGQGLFVKPS